MRSAIRTCPLCEATCGLELTVEDDGTVSRIRGDADDVFSRGFLCPKGASLKALQEDPDRLHGPVARQPDGSFAPIGWDAAFALIEARLGPVLEHGGRDAAAAYLGNPTVHSLGAQLYGRVLLKALGTRNLFSASTVDQMPKHVSAGRMFGSGFSIPVPDVDRTDYLLVLGANPLVSNGSLLTAPDMRGRLRKLRERGGRIVVVDPRRTRTAEAADRHLPIQPGTDALALMALVHVLFEEGLVDLAAVEAIAEPGAVQALRTTCAEFSPEAVATPTGLQASALREVARELAGASSAAVYGRIGTCTQAFGTLTSWLVDVLNALTGNLDRPGGAMFPRPAAAGRPPSRPQAFGRWSSRVRGLPEALGELPVACLSEEIETPGEGRIRALFTLAGNPVLSTPDGERLSAALDGLDLMVSVDLYVNETTRHADVILPPPSPLERSHYDLSFYALSARNVANYSPPVLERPLGAPDEWEILLRLAAIAGGAGAGADLAGLDDLVAGQAAQREGIDLATLEPARRGPERLLDLLLRAGPYDLTLSDLEAAPHGIDLGALEPRLPDLLPWEDGRVRLAPAEMLADVPRLAASLGVVPNGAMVLIGRRQLRSNNSWMHNLAPLMKGREQCTLQVHPDDAARHGLADGGRARVSTARGAVELPVEATDTIRPGVVSIPHGWGHDAPGARLGVAAAHAGVNANVLADTTAVDPLSGNAVLCGIPVELAKA